MNAPTAIRFSAYAMEDGRAHDVPGAESFAEAALMFTEVWRPIDEGELRVIVVDHESGEQECFCVDLAAAAAAPCD